MYITSPGNQKKGQESPEKSPFLDDVRVHPFRYIAGAGVALCYLAFFLITANLLPAPLRAVEQERMDPAPATNKATVSSPKTEKSVFVAQEAARRIVIPNAGVDSIINNPSSTDAATLDLYLTKGAVRYPGSGSPGSGNMFLFGHSTNWTVVRNQAYKTFNNIQNLEPGDEIKVYGDAHVYRYTVTSVRMARASEVFIDLSSKTNMLTISTCNTFGEKEDRFIVEATYVSKKPIDI